MTKTKYILTASALALIANTAGALDFYGNFSNHETVVHSGSKNVQTPSRSAYMPETRTSLDALTEGNPDSAGHSILGYGAVMSATAPRITSLEVLTAGNPDSAVHPIRSQGFSRPASAMAASQPWLAPDGV